MESFNVKEASGDIPDEGWNDDDVPFRCEVCSTPLEYGGRGRYPTRCDEHKKNKSSSTGTSGKSFKGSAQLEMAVANMYRTAAFGLAIFEQHDAMVIASSADKLAHSWILLAESDPKVRKYLEKMVTGSGWGAVIVAHMMIVVPIMVHHNKFPTGLLSKLAPKEP